MVDAGAAPPFFSAAIAAFASGCPTCASAACGSFLNRRRNVLSVLSRSSSRSATLGSSGAERAVVFFVARSPVPWPPPRPLDAI